MLDWITPELIWFLSGAALVLLEFMIPGLVVIFFGVGALITSLIVWIGIISSTNYQILFCAIISLILLFSLRKWMKKNFLGYVLDKSKMVSPIDEFTGKKVEIIETVGPDNKVGKVKFKGSSWKAKSESEIQTGNFAEIIDKDGITLIVK